ncbi:MAG: hypothetical protein JWQ95_1889 [Sphaerisporangium sp.]|nr:hypothetical protein [Sphaerisporangium sp.]
MTRRPDLVISKQCPTTLGRPRSQSDPADLPGRHAVAHVDHFGESASCVPAIGVGHVLGWAALGAAVNRVTGGP